MELAGINILTVLIAGVASFIFGGFWYGVLAKPWQKAAGLLEEEIKGRTSPLPIIYAALANLFMAFIMARLLAHLGVDLLDGLIFALFIWGGFILPSLFVNYSFQKRPFTLTLIDAGHWLGVLLIISYIIGLMGVGS